ncbi:hypothetical protein PAHAL_1G354200 [Panicum hallii]|jgi:hypothetical protein|uniref:Uncharacterized protein n=1 Tax=Panicum hallii TaxID=206008 RepID=A0A2T8KXF7_9POAL|nr:hypothetical protein PAHAL_1G354200 [Panicum hallii]
MVVGPPVSPPLLSLSSSLLSSPLLSPLSYPSPLTLRRKPPSPLSSASPACSAGRAGPRWSCSSLARRCWPAAELELAWPAVLARGGGRARRGGGGRRGVAVGVGGPYGAQRGGGPAALGLGVGLGHGSAGGSGDRLAGPGGLACRGLERWARELERRGGGRRPARVRGEG